MPFKHQPFASASAAAFLFVSGAAALPSGSAQAATFEVSNATELLAAFTSANTTPAADTIVILPGEIAVSTPLVVSAAGGPLLLRGPAPPREVDDVDAIEDSILTYDLAAILSGDLTVTVLTRELIRVEPGATLTVENLYLRMPEILCDDGNDNDGNGLADGGDPFCEALGAIDTSGGLAELLFSSTVRAITAREGSNLAIESCRIQGWSFGVNGSAVFVDEGASFTVNGSLVVNNIGRFFARLSGAWAEGYGAFYAAATNTTITNTRFLDNTQAYGGALYFTSFTGVDSPPNPNVTVTLTDNVFRSNTAEDGGALFVESVRLDLVRNQFVNNRAAIERLEGGVPNGVDYEGGDLFCEDCAANIRNNVFAQSGTLGFASSLAFRGNLGSQTPAPADDFPPIITNNTFVEQRNGDGGGFMLVENTGFSFRNNIVAGSSGGGVLAVNLPTAAGFRPDVEYNTFFDMDPSAIFLGELNRFRVNLGTNLLSDPRFTFYVPEGDPQQLASWRFWLRLDSPAIDAGDPLLVDVGGSRLDQGALGGADAGTTDFDGDGWVDIYDCDDNNPNVFPGAYDECDEARLDENCDGIPNENEIVLFEDRDGDSFGVRPTDTNGYSSATICPGELAPPLASGGWVGRVGDCNDDPALDGQFQNPEQPEICDGLDNNCDGLIDNGIPTRLFYTDDDGDGFGAIDPILPPISVACPPPGYSPFPTDCDDSNPQIHPLITLDARSHAPLATAALEANEADRDVTFVADGFDQDCDGGDLCYADFDGDGFGSPPVNGVETYAKDSDLSCDNASDSTSSNSLDCDDRDPKTFPGAPEVVGDGIDNDCNGLETCYVDADGDGFGNDAELVEIPGRSCIAEGAASRGGDCDDSTELANPFRTEVCDGIDNDCDGEVDEVTSAAAENWFFDGDGDGFGDLRQSLRACGQPVGYVREREEGFDCDDDDPRAFPGNDERCDGIDNNCNGLTDEPEAIDVVTWYADFDQDGFGNGDVVEVACEAPGANYVRAGRELDCNDQDPTVGPCFSCDGCASATARPSNAALGFAVLMLAGLRRRRKAA